MPRARHHHRERAEGRRHAPHHPLRYRSREVHLLRLLRGELPGGFHRRDPHPRVPRRGARRSPLHQADVARDRRQVRAHARRRPRPGRALPLMDFALVLFYLFGAVLLGAALMVVMLRNPVHAALFLVLSFFTAAALWMLLYAEFLAITLVLVYVGAVMVLFLFVVMMLDINIDLLREGFWKNAPLAALVGLLMAFEMAALLLRGSKGAADAVPAPAANYSNTKALGSGLYTDYVFPFELAAAILLGAIIAAIPLTLRHRKETKYQDPHTQLSVKPGDRLRAVKMKAEGGQ